MANGNGNGGANGQKTWMRRDDATAPLGHVLEADFGERHYEAWRGHDGKWRLRVGRGRDAFVHKPFSSYELLRRRVAQLEGLQGVGA